MAKSNKTSGRMDTPVLLDRRSKEKSSFFNQKRKGLLSFYGNISRIPVLGSVFSETARKVVGGSLHTHKVEVNSTCNQQCRTCYVSDRKARC